MAKRSGAEKADIKIRLTESLRSKIERSAKSRGVSMNSDMIDRLERSFKSDAYLQAEISHRSDLDKTVDKLLSEIHRLSEQLAEHNRVQK